MLVEQEIQRTLKLGYERQISDLQRWISELEVGKNWLQEQVTSWQSQYEQQVSTNNELCFSISELEVGKNWLQEQVTSWQSQYEQQASTNNELRLSISELEIWKQEAEQLKASVRELQEQNTNLCRALERRSIRHWITRLWRHRDPGA
jgi:chromosome segregation ATPase